MICMLAKLHEFTIGDAIRINKFCNGPQWIAGTVEKQLCQSDT